jgi:hypothetical protein
MRLCAGVRAHLRASLSAVAAMSHASVHRRRLATGRQEEAPENVGKNSKTCCNIFKKMLINIFVKMFF